MHSPEVASLYVGVCAGRLNGQAAVCCSTDSADAQIKFFGKLTQE